MENAYSYWDDREGQKGGSSQNGGGITERASCWLWSRREEMGCKPGGQDGQ